MKIKIDRLILVPALLIAVWAILAAGTIATLAGLPVGAKARVQQSPVVEEIVVRGEPGRPAEEIHVEPLR
jgi:hypothetical protein